jgi:hypothetical protein
MQNFVIFPKLNRVRQYQFKCAWLLTAVPLVCAVTLSSIMFFFAQLNLYYLENSGLIVSDQIRQAYYIQVQMQLLETGWIIACLFLVTFIVSVVIMNWAVSPFVNAETVLRAALKDPKGKREESDWLSESPLFHHVIWGLAQRLSDNTHAFDKIDEPQYRFNFRFMFKFVCSFFAVSMMTGYVVGIVLNTVYLKIVDLAISLVRMNQRGYYFVAQEEMLKTGVTFMIALCCLVYLIIGIYVTRYLSNMLFVFTRAVKERHFPLKLRDSDVYHSLADAISEVAVSANLGRKAGTD